MKGELITIVRKSDDGVQTLGDGMITDAYMAPLYQFHTLELPWKNNQRRISCIPAGDYEIEKRYSQKYGWHLHVLDVPGRDFILIHPGNFHTDILGCILPGEAHIDINGDRRPDVVKSRTAMKEIMKLMPNRGYLKIIYQND